MGWTQLLVLEILHWTGWNPLGVAYKGAGAKSNKIPDSQPKRFAREKTETSIGHARPAQAASAHDR